MSAPAQYRIGEYVVETRTVPLIVDGRLQPGIAYNVTHPSPEGYARWCGMAHSREEAEELIGRDRRFRMLAAGRRPRTKPDKERAA
jgi:hypothetical protein